MPRKEGGHPGRCKLIGVDIMQRKNVFEEFKNPGTVVITGASSGLGESFAKEFAKYGFDLVLIARRKERLQKIAEKLESEYLISCNIISADLSIGEDIKKVADYIRQIETLDILVNNAGFGTQGYFFDVPITKSMQMLNVHMTAAIQLTYSALHVLINRKRGVIINVSSLGAFTLTPGNVLYDATKSFLVTFSENLRMEVEDKGIIIQALCPGFVRTEFHEVGDLKDFDQSKVPDSLWMTPEIVVSQSLKALGKDKKTICIPGWKNKLSKWLVMHCSFIRKTIQEKVKARDLP